MNCSLYCVKRAKAILLTCFFFLSFYGTLIAQTVTIDAKNASLKNVMSSITSQTGFTFAYSEEIKADDIKVSFSFKKTPLNESLTKIFTPLSITYKIDGKIISLKQIQIKSNGERKRHQVFGKVFDSHGKPIAEAMVKIQGERIGSTTDIDGSYFLSAEPSDIIQFSAMGYSPLKQTVGNRYKIDVTLNDSVLDEVVVTGYQSLSKERSAGSFNMLKGETLVDKANARGSILESLEGAAPGLLVNMNSRNTTEKYSVRGLTSTGTHSERKPLFVVDGVAISGESIENLLNSNDIESITILKDATAASIWGAQAANGVIVIETKSGKNTDGKYNIKYSGTYTYKGKEDYAYQNLMDSKTFIKNSLEIFDPIGYPYLNAKNNTLGSGNFIKNPILFPHEVPMYQAHMGEITTAQRDEQLAILAGRDWREQYEKYFMSDAWLTRNSVSIEGGNARSQLFSSISYDGNKGTMQNYNDNIKINLREVFNFNKWMKFDFALNTSLLKANNHIAPTYGAGRGALSSSSMSISSLPYAVFYDEAGNKLDHSIYDMQPELKTRAEGLLGHSLDYFPIEDFNSSMHNRKNVTVRANTGITINLLKGLKYEGRFAYNRSNIQEEKYYPSNSYFVRYERGTTLETATGTQYGPTSGGDYVTSDHYATDWTIRNQFSLDKSINHNHQIVALAGIEFRENHLESNNMSKLGFDYQTMTSAKYDITRIQRSGISSILSPMLATYGLFSSRSDDFSITDAVYRYYSLYSNAGYTYNGKYTLNGSIRVDQSNLFGSDPSVQFKPIWSAGAIWNAKKENFMSDVNFLNKLNIRLSYGLGGNSPTSNLGGPFNILSSGSSTMVKGVTYNITTPANDKVLWEKTTTTNLGVDFSALGNRIYGTFDIYNKYTTDLLDRKELDPTVGHASVISNVGEISNKGIEVNLGGTIIQQNDLRWDASINFSYNKNKVISFYHTPYTTANTMITPTTIEGYTLNPVFSLKWAGLNPDNGMPRVYNKDGAIHSGLYSTLTYEDVMYMGTTIPPYFGSLSNNLRYKNFNLYFMFTYNFGHKIFNDQLTYWYDRMGENVHADFDKRWRQTGDEQFTNVPSYMGPTSGRNYSSEKSLYQYSDIHVLDGAFMKLREIKVSYNLPHKSLKTLSLNGLSVYAQANNLFYIAANKQAIDPEWTSARGGYNPARLRASYTLGLNINF